MGSNKTYQRIFLSFILFLFLSIIYLPSVCAQGYYAEITIDVDSSGYVTIDGTTNYPDLLVSNTQNYTSKKQSTWSLNITKEDVFSEFIYEITLPRDSSVSYIKTSGFRTIQENNGYFIINGVGENESLSILIQYQTEKTTEGSIIKLDFVNIILFTSIIILIIILFFLIVKDKKKTVENKPLNDTITGYDFKGLNDRQKQIMKLLIDRKIPLTQTDIQRELNIPKAAVSRNIHGLECKGLIEKEQIGMSNLIRLKKI